MEATPIIPSHVLMFKPEFAPLVEDGRKKRTIRPPRKRKIYAGHCLDLRKWTGRPYASKQAKLKTSICSGVSTVEILHAHHIELNSRMLCREERDEFAKADGFEGSIEMADFFAREHGLPFKGELIEWN